MKKISIQEFRTRFGQTDLDINPKTLGLVSALELEVLVRLCQHFQIKRFVEVGVYEGKTAANILRRCDFIEKYIGVDVVPDCLSQNYKRLFDGVIDKSTNIPLNSLAERGKFAKYDSRFELMMLPQMDGLKNNRGLFLPNDMVFIDGDHNYVGVLNDTNIVLERLNKQGVIVWHDVVFPGISRAINDVEVLRDNVCHVLQTQIGYLCLGLEG